MGKRILSVILMVCMMLTLLTGCTNDAKIASDFKNDFQKDGKFLFHGLKQGMGEDEVFKKEHITKSDLITPNINSDASGITFLLNTNEKLYGIDGKVRRLYCFCYNGNYSNGGIIIYFKDEKKYLEACKKIGKLLKEDFGDPTIVNSNVKYDKKKAWDSFINPPKFATQNEMESYENKHPEKTAIPGFEWGTLSKDNSLYVIRSPRVKLNRNIYNDHTLFYDNMYKGYFIELMATY